MKKLILVFVLLPVIVFSQLTEKDIYKLEELLAQAEGLSEYDYNLAVSVSDSLLLQHPKDSLVLVNRVNLYHMYVRKSKCQKHVFPNIPNLCEKALEFYTQRANNINNPRLYFAKGMIYYNWAKYNGKDTKTEALNLFNKALTEGNYADFEKSHIRELIMHLQ